MVLLRLVLPAGVYETIGAVTSRPYAWHGNGAEIEVEEADAWELLARRARRGCCGSPPRDYPLFVQVRQEVDR